MIRDQSFDYLLSRLGRWEGVRQPYHIKDDQIVADPPLSVVETFDRSGPDSVYHTVQLPGSPLLEFTLAASSDALAIAPSGKAPTPLPASRGWPGGSYSNGDVSWSRGERLVVELAIVEAGRRMSLVTVYGGDGHLERAVTADLVSDRRHSPATVVDREWYFGEFAGEGQRWRGDEPMVTTDSGIVLADEGESFILRWRSGPAGETWRGRRAGESVVFPDEGVTLFFLPDGWAFFPLALEAGRSFTIERAWQPEPGRQIRILRSYGDDGRWIQTSLIGETRTEMGAPAD
ncbi:MAG: DUF3598 family protein [Dehalococcoidia bacterium]